jgi:integrase/recombinase XerD
MITHYGQWLPTNHQANIAKVRESLGYANIATTGIYDHRKTRRDNSSTFKVQC